LKLGISQKTLTDAVMGNAAAYKAVTDAVKSAGNSDTSWKVAKNLAIQSGALKEGAQNAKDKAAADKGAAGRRRSSGPRRRPPPAA
jgi:hypothetical protein